MPPDKSICKVLITKIFVQKMRNESKKAKKMDIYQLILFKPLNICSQIIYRHIGPKEEEISKMLTALEVDSIEGYYPKPSQKKSD